MNLISAFSFIFGLVIGIVSTALIVMAVYRKNQKKIENNLSNSEKEKLLLTHSLNELKSQLAVATERATNKLEFYEQRVTDLLHVHENMKEAFASISKESLLKNADLMNTSFQQSMEHFLKVNERERALTNDGLKDVVSPLKESLSSIDRKVMELEKERQGAYSGLIEQIGGLLQSQTNLHIETKNLARALNAPTIRGRWGEMQLRRVVELSGLSAHCDFVEQKSVRVEEDLLRPDMIVTLPKNKKIVIDAKVPLELFGQDETAEWSESNGVEFAGSLRRHLALLKKKNYHKILNGSPEFIVLFLPGEVFLSRALAADPSLLDYGAQNEIIIATPVTLIALLKAIAFGFKQEAVANNIEEVRKLSQQMIDRVQKVFEHFEKLGKTLRQATESYNQTLSSLDSRVLVTARKLTEIKGVSDMDQDLLSGKNAYIDVVPNAVNFKQPCDGDA